MKSILTVLLVVLTTPAFAEVLCIKGDVNVENGQVVNSNILARGETIECPDDTRMIIQEPDEPPQRKVLTSTEIKRLREKTKQTAEAPQSSK